VIDLDGLFGSILYDIREYLVVFWEVGVGNGEIGDIGEVVDKVCIVVY
jgi:hypothetical protein